MPAVARVWLERAATALRPGLAALEACRAGASLVVGKLNRFGRALAHLVETVQTFAARGSGVRSLHEHLDTTTAGGKLIVHVCFPRRV